MQKESEGQVVLLVVELEQSELPPGFHPQHQFHCLFSCHVFDRVAVALNALELLFETLIKQICMSFNLHNKIIRLLNRKLLTLKIRVASLKST